MINTIGAEAYIRDGCGRCAHYRTPECKVRPWAPELTALRELLLASDLTEEMKWGAPCYTFDGQNVAMLTALKGFCAISFFKGAALADPAGVLVPPGPNSRFARYLKFQSVTEIDARWAETAGFIEKAIAFERAGGQFDPGAASEPVPAELEARLATDPTLREAFDGLTPGRRRSHILHIGGGKKAATRERRVDKCAPKILAGKGFNER